MTRCYQLIPLITTTQILFQKLALKEIVICKRVWNVWNIFNVWVLNLLAYICFWSLSTISLQQKVICSTFRFLCLILLNSSFYIGYDLSYWIPNSWKIDCFLLSLVFPTAKARNLYKIGSVLC